MGISGNISATNGAAITYDGLRRRVRKSVTADSVTHDNYYSASWQMLEVRKNSDADPLDQYVWCLRYIDAVAVRFHDDNLDGDYNDGNDTTYYYTNDANMNVTTVISQSAVRKEGYTYDAYGKPLFLADDWDVRNTQTSGRSNPILYAGYHYDEETGLYNVRHRSYHPTLGRWMQTDPKDRMYGPTPTGGYHDGMNLYEYVKSSTMVYVDSWGLETGATPAPAPAPEPEPWLTTPNGTVIMSPPISMVGPRQCQVILLWGHGTQNPKKNRQLAAMRDIEGTWNYYGAEGMCAVGALGCWTDGRNLDANGRARSTSIPGMPNCAGGTIGAAPSPRCTNGGMNPPRPNGRRLTGPETAQGFGRLISRAWKAALDHGHRLSQKADCKKCIDCKIEVLFKCNRGAGKDGDAKVLVSRYNQMPTGSTWSSERHFYAGAEGDSGDGRRRVRGVGGNNRRNEPKGLRPAKYPTCGTKVEFKCKGSSQ